MIHGYKQLIVWQKAKQLAISVYTLTEKFPREEIYGLTSQMRRSAISIASNIAEGRMRGTKKDFLSFLRIAYGSGAELETQLEISKEVFKKYQLNYSDTDLLLEEIMKILNVMIRNMNPDFKASEAKAANS